MDLLAEFEDGRVLAKRNEASVDQHFKILVDITLFFLVVIGVRFLNTAEIEVLPDGISHHVTYGIHCHCLFDSILIYECTTSSVVGLRY